ncbi:MAG TPA: sigma-70 family RNA polymerase sigma factor [Thermoanaerobaculia bacterium]|nr:sigma-70 family RNA polymerase sigma factor [Thermoanaerobaculia bacterium]
MTTQPFESDVLLARRGDEAAFRRLVDRSANTVCSIALAIVRNVHASEDIAQEVFLAAWANLRTLRNPASFMPWLRQVTRNQAHLWRREHARETHDDALVAAAVDARPAADDLLFADEETRVLREVLDQLPDEAREVLVLYYREESSTRQVAALLGISDAAVRQRLSRSRALVREEMLERFGRTARRTAPSVAFAAALTLSAPAASAAVAATATTGAVLKASLIGGTLGWAGVLLGMRALEPAIDDEEARSLRRFRNTALAVVTLGAIAIAMNTATALRILISVQSVYTVLGALYLVWLPRILKRRDPEARRLSLRGTIARAGGAAIVGAMFMAALTVYLND